MDLSEAEFISEEELISIIPNFNSSSFDLFRHSYGPFEAGLPIDLPLWIALYLKQRRKCTIVPPTWLTVENLESLIQLENNDHVFIEMPNPCYMEIAQLLLQYATDDVPDAANVKTLLCDLADIRMAKLKNNMDIFVKSGSSYAQITNLTQFEICRIRHVFTAALNLLHELRGVAKESDSNGLP